MKWYPGFEIAKDPDAVLDWQFDFSNWLLPGESIASYTVTVPPGLTLDSDSETAGAVTVWLSGGTVGVRYDVTVRVTTDNVPPHIDDRTATFVIEEQ